MISWVNYNQQVREALLKYFNLNKIKFEEHSELFFNFQKDISDIQFANEEWYKYIIGLTFIDNYLLLKDKEKNNKLNEQDANLLKQCLKIQYIEQLLSIIKNDEEFLRGFVFSSLTFSELSVKEKGLLFANNIDMKFIAKFSPLTCIEKEYFYQDESIKLLLDNYKKKTTADSNCDILYYIQNKIFEESNFADKILLKATLNPNNFETLVRQMISTIYKREKFILTHIGFYSIFPFALKLIILVESNDLNMIEEIKKDTVLYNYVANEFLYYNTQEIDLNQKAEVEDYYENHVDNTIKHRLEGKTKKKEM